MSGNRRYPNLPQITGDMMSHTMALQATKETLEIATRRTADLTNSFVCVGDLVDLGILKVVGGNLALGDAFTP